MLVQRKIVEFLYCKWYRWKIENECVNNNNQMTSSSMCVCAQLSLSYPLRKAIEGNDLEYGNCHRSTIYLIVLCTVMNL